mgnify:CR=1 FL=1
MKRFIFMISCFPVLSSFFSLLKNGRKKQESDILIPPAGGAADFLTNLKSSHILIDDGVVCKMLI